jgi:predicted nucleic acid-binding protein
MRVLLDVNVILDAILQRAPWYSDAEAIIKAHVDGHISCAVITHSLATVFYLSRKTIGTAAARTAVRRCLATFEVLQIDKQSLLDADAQQGTDFEDNILIAAATTASLDAIITRNPTDFVHSPIPIWEPAELLKTLSAGGAAGGSSPTTP